MTSQRTRNRLISLLKQNHIKNNKVLNVMSEMPRHLFVDEALSHRAYEDSALPIGHRQTISQPYTVAKMTELLLTNKPKRILEIGTGSGYQAAVLSLLVKEVYSIERIAPLLVSTRQRLRQLRLYNIFLRHGDGYQGWPGKSPFDAIIVATKHNIFLKMFTINQIKKLSSTEAVLVDIKELYDKDKVIKKGIVYWSL